MPRTPTTAERFALVLGASAFLLSSLVGCGLDAEPHPTPSGNPPSEASTPRPSRTPEVFDSGVREGATGAVVLNANGTPWRYTVEPGDYADAICYRFNLASEQLVFDETGEHVGPEIYPGDVIRFIPLSVEEGH